MKKPTLLILLSLSFIFLTCKNNLEANNTKEKQVLENQIDPLIAIEVEQQKDLANAYYYVLAPNGLSFRKEDNLNSEKLLTLPLGSKVKQTAPIYTIDLTVENINGSMMEVLYNGKTGYVFSGFLSKYPPLEIDEDFKSYIMRLKKINSNVEYEEKETPPDFHEGIIETTTLPNVVWHEAFYLAKAAYTIPNSLSFPKHQGNDEEIIKQKDKEDRVWSSELTVSRKFSKLDTIRYNWRAEATGYFVIITEPKINEFKIEYTGFAD